MRFQFRISIVAGAAVICCFLQFLSYVSASAHSLVTETEDIGVCELVEAHLAAGTLNEVEVQIEDLRIDFDEDGVPDGLVKRRLGSSQSMHLGYIDVAGVFRLLGPCYGCASATTRDVLMLKIRDDLYVLSLQRGEQSFLYLFNEPLKSELCRFGSSADAR